MKGQKFSDLPNENDIDCTTVEILSDSVMFFWKIVRITSGQSENAVYTILNILQINNWISICNRQS